MQKRLFSVGLTVLGQSSPSSSAGGTDMCTVLVGAESEQLVLPVLRVRIQFTLLQNSYSNSN